MKITKAWNQELALARRLWCALDYRYAMTHPANLARIKDIFGADMYVDINDTEVVRPMGWNSYIQTNVRIRNGEAFVELHLDAAPLFEIAVVESATCRFLDEPVEFMIVSAAGPMNLKNAQPFASMLMNLCSSKNPVVLYR